MVFPDIISRHDSVQEETIPLQHTCPPAGYSIQCMLTHADSYSKPGFQCHMKPASVLTFINKQTLIDEYETKNIDLGQNSHEGHVFSLLEDNAIIKTVTY